ncbi:hypothetical protein BpHYR1_037522 [Brachionus plicatilis]|uniref:Uncharacterized protein n=1 Tax=Brachionus plicatilis TaxID=10195 RepID=A0A3M7S0J6_BRAPC|nr:hypothetical protein BpHYR1_037522 [Brachionus plicatilis]
MEHFSWEITPIISIAIGITEEITIYLKEMNSVLKKKQSTTNIIFQITNLNLSRLLIKMRLKRFQAQQNLIKTSWNKKKKKHNRLFNALKLFRKIVWSLSVIFKLKIESINNNHRTFKKFVTFQEIFKQSKIYSINKKWGYYFMCKPGDKGSVE